MSTIESPDILFTIYSLGPGGAQKVVTTMANYWVSRGRKVKILTLERGFEKSFYHIDENVEVVNSELWMTNNSIFLKVFLNIYSLYKLRQLIKFYNPEYIISFIDTMNIKVIISTLFTKYYVIVSERGDPFKRDIGKIRSLFRSITYKYSHKVVVQSEGVYEKLSSTSFSEKIVVIPNPVTANNHSYEIPYIKRPYIVSVGRLVNVKRHDLLLDAFRQIANKYHDWSLVILGDGPLRHKLESIIIDYCLEGRVSMLGLKKNVHDYLKNADMFVLCSDMEGFPNALLEAMACGLPVICTNCSSGPREIIRDGINGVLVEPGNVDNLYAAIEDLVHNPEKRSELSKEAKNVLCRYDLDVVMNMWENVVILNNF